MNVVYIHSPSEKVMDGAGGWYGGGSVQQQNWGDIGHGGRVHTKWVPAPVKRNV